MSIRQKTYKKTYDLTPDFIIENNHEDHLDDEIVGKIFNDMIWSIALESEKNITEIIKILEEYYNINLIINYLKKVNSPFTSENPIWYFSNGEAIRRTSAIHTLKNVIKKMRKSICKEIKNITNIDYDALSISFYRCLNERN